MKMKETVALAVLVLMLAGLAMFQTAAVNRELQSYAEELDARVLGLEMELEAYQWSNEKHHTLLREQQAQLDHTLRLILDELQKWEWVEVEASGYAPLDPNAVKGVCHDGNPNYTATGTRPTPGRTLAVDPKVIPYGSRVYIPGKGFYFAEDTGSMIRQLSKDGLPRIDICFATRAEAFAWGRRVITIAIRRFE